MRNYCTYKCDFTMWIVLHCNDEINYTVTDILLIMLLCVKKIVYYYCKSWKQICKCNYNCLMHRQSKIIELKVQKYIRIKVLSK